MTRMMSKAKETEARILPPRTVMAVSKANL